MRRSPSFLPWRARPAADSLRLDCAQWAAKE
jgi:hypothetical protein